MQHRPAAPPAHVTLSEKKPSAEPSFAFASVVEFAPSLTTRLHQRDGGTLVWPACTLCISANERALIFRLWPSNCCHIAIVRDIEIRAYRRCNAVDGCALSSWMGVNVCGGAVCCPATCQLTLSKVAEKIPVMQLIKIVINKRTCLQAFYQVLPLQWLRQSIFACYTVSLMTAPP